MAFLDKALFTSYHYTTISSFPHEDGTPIPLDPPIFQISLPALLETLQIFGVNDTPRFSSGMAANGSDHYSTNIRPQRPNAFSGASLGMTGVCRLSYTGAGSPLSIILEEAGVVTTCNLVTYEPDSVEEIPFEKDRLSLKIIMQARWLFDAISELSSTSPNRLDIIASSSAPWLSLAGTGPLGSASVEFSKDSRALLETFSVAKRWTQSYQFEMVRAASEAMKIASKVSVRGDEQGVLSLQFMVEVEGGGVSFVDFRFVPFLAEGESEESSEEGDEEASESGKADAAEYNTDDDEENEEL